MTTARAFGFMGLIGLALAGQSTAPVNDDVFDRVTHGYATSEGGVKIHFASLGEGLLADVAAVVKSLGRDQATVVGHDWGGIVAWNAAMSLP